MMLKIKMIGFQAPATPIMEGIIDLHNYIFIFLLGIFVFVMISFVYLLFYYYYIPTYLYKISSKNNFRNDAKIVLLSYNTSDELKKATSYKHFLFLVKQNLFYGFNQLIIYIRNNVMGSVLGHRMERDYEVNYNIYRIEKSLYEMFRLMSITSLRFEILETRKVVHGTLIEIIWTIIPSVILLCIAIPSFSLLYSMDEIIDPKLTVKAIGYQWFWSYEYGQEYDELLYDYLTDSLGYNYKCSREALVYDSVLVSDSMLYQGDHRLLEVDHQLILPVNTHLRMIITAGDVLHSWAVPALGVKLDAIPGRLSQVGLYIKREGVFYGQCSELCGVNHGFMPIAVKVVSLDNFLNWYHKITFSWN